MMQIFDHQIVSDRFPDASQSILQEKSCRIMSSMTPNIDFYSSYGAGKVHIYIRSVGRSFEEKCQCRTFDHQSVSNRFPDASQLIHREKSC